MKLKYSLKKPSENGECYKREVDHTSFWIEHYASRPGMLASPTRVLDWRSVPQL